MIQLIDLLSNKSSIKVMANHSVKGYSELYASPEDMDLWTAGISERPLPGSMVIQTTVINHMLTITILSQAKKL